MNLPIPNAKRVEEFKQMYLKDFGVELTQQQAYDALADLAALVYPPCTTSRSSRCAGLSRDARVIVSKYVRNSK